MIRVYGVLTLKRVLFYSFSAIAILFLYNNCGPSFKSSDDAALDSLGDSTINYSTCDIEEAPTSQLKSRRLTFLELSISMKGLLGDSVHQELTSTLNLYPKFSYETNVDEFDSEMTKTHLEAISTLAFNLPTALVNSPQVFKSLLPSCSVNSGSGLSINLSQHSCNQQIINELSLLFHRRPLEAGESQNYMDILESSDSAFENNTQKLSTLISALILSPKFSMILNHYNDNGRVDNYTLASRVSFLAGGRTPSLDLLEDAKSGRILNQEIRMKRAREIIQTPLGREYVRGVFNRYLKLWAVSQSLNANYAEFLGIGTEGLVEDLKTEALDFSEYVSFEMQGTFQDLLLDPASFPKSPDMAKILGVSSSNSSVQNPVATSSIRKGLLMRPVLFLAPEARTSPIHRGYVFSKQALCMKIPPPSPDLLAVAEELEKEVDPFQLTSGELAEHITSPQSCQGCHSHINPPGFAFEQFGAFGQERQMEDIFDADGRNVNTLPIATQTDFRIGGASYGVNNASQMIELVANSPEGQICFAKKIFENTRLVADERGNNCALADMESTVVNQKSLLELMVTNAAHSDLLY